MAKWPIGFRKTVQSVWTVLTNGYIIGFFKGKIYTGNLKNMCVPGLNCYSCPGSLGSCPIGSLQAVLGSAKYKFSFYLLGFFLLVGTLFGRLVCGFLCPFGLIQELLYKIPFVKKIKTFRLDRPLRWLKYIILAVFVILLPLFIVDAAGTGSPWFCKWICPAGTLEGGIPLISASPALQGVIGFLFHWKLAILLITVLLSILIYRPFCKYICPLGAIYALFNKVSVYRYHVDREKCTSCGKCEKVCPMQISPVRETNHLECIRCGGCKEICSSGAITSGFSLGSKNKGKKS
ncbi:putative electron transport protein YccM [Clostridiales bacterium]|nr:putative electron transport protein YccM [Clostridiales bacterium]